MPDLKENVLATLTHEMSKSRGDPAGFLEQLIHVIKQRLVLGRAGNREVWTEAVMAMNDVIS